MIIFSKIFYSSRIIKEINKRDFNVLDYGCGVSTVEREKLDKINDIFYFDINKNLKKYYKENFYYEFDKIKNIKFDCIVFSSVIQYIPENDLKLVLNKTFKMLNEDGYLLILDIPKLPRFIEIFIWMFFDFERFYKAFRLIKSQDYKESNFYIHSKQILKIKESKNVKLKNKMFDTRSHFRISKN